MEQSTLYAQPSHSYPPWLTSLSLIKLTSICLSKSTDYIDPAGHLKGTSG